MAKAIPTAAQLRDSGEYGYEPVKTKGEYETLALVRGKSNPKKTWKILRHKATGVLKCSCPAFIFKGERDEQGNKTCKHLTAYRASPEAFESPEAVEQAAALAAQTAEREARVLAWLTEAAQACGTLGADYTYPRQPKTLRDLLYERQWNALAKALAPKLDPASLNAPTVTAAPTPAPFQRRLRIIELDD